ncbi:MAG TPA: hypothetical protein VFR24_27705 [Candidatus Angelobacter sp.]|nr:hypothetical protein [Candidatus Angelobacter sp.]
MTKRPKPENQVLREKVKCVEEIRDTILAAWKSADLDCYVEQRPGIPFMRVDETLKMLATSAAAVCVNIIEEAIREDEKRRK